MKFYDTAPGIREALLAMGYTESQAGKWLKPIAYQLFTYSEEKSEWVCWFKPADGGIPARMETKKFQHGEDKSSYVDQIKQFEQWTKKDVYTPSNFELGKIDL